MFGVYSYNLFSKLTDNFSIYCHCSIAGLVTQWQNSSGSLYSPYVRGGIQYSNGIATVPSDGLYYVYVQMYFRRYSGSNSVAYFCIAINGTCQSNSYMYTQEYTTVYIGRSLLLKSRDQLSVYIQSQGYYLFLKERTFFGAFVI